MTPTDSVDEITAMHNELATVRKMYEASRHKLRLDMRVVTERSTGMRYDADLSFRQREDVRMAYGKSTKRLVSHLALFGYERSGTRSFVDTCYPALPSIRVSLDRTMDLEQLPREVLTFLYYMGVWCPRHYHRRKRFVQPTVSWLPPCDQQAAPSAPLPVVE